MALVLNASIGVAGATSASARVQSSLESSIAAGHTAGADSARSPSISAHLPLASPGGKSSREVFGFALASSLADPTLGYPSWNFDTLSTVAFFGVHVDTAGQFAGDSGWTSWNSSALTSMVSIAHQHGTKVVLTIVLQDFSANTPNMCAGLNHAATTVAETAAEIAAKHVDGVNIDYEGLDGSCGNSDPYWAQHAMTHLVQLMRQTLGGSAYISVDTYAGAAADPVGFFDVAGIAAYADSLFVMAYDMEYSNYGGSPPGCSSFCLGPTAPVSAYRYNDASIIGQYTRLVTASKVILGVPYYGRKACVGSVAPNQYPTSSVVADSYLDASGEASYFEVKAGTYVEHRDPYSAGGERWDTWFNTTLGCIRELYWDDVTSLGLKYDLVNSTAIRGVGIWNLNYGGGAPELWAALAGHFAKCASATLSTAPATPQGTGVKVVLTAASTGCASPQYRFWVQDPGRPWTLVQDYSVTNTYTWVGTGAPGTYGLEVDVRASPATTYDAVANLAYGLKACTSATLSSDVASPQQPGAVVALTGGAACTGTPQYRFWIRPPGGAWAVVQDYGSASTYRWATAGQALGTYGLEVDVRDQGVTASYETVAGMSFILDPPCGKPSLAPSPASPQGVGASITLTAVTGTCPTPRYRFWIEPPGGRWSVVQDYSAASTYTWKTSALLPGSYNLEVDVKDASSPEAYDAVTNLTDVLATCTAAHLSPNLSTPQEPGAVVVLSGSANCPGTPEYRFWVRAPGGGWVVARDYSTTAAYSWSSAGKPNGVYGLEVDVRDKGSPAVYESVSNLSFLIDSCTKAHLSPNKSTPQPAGSVVIFTGSAVCAGTPQYRFWIRPPGGTWAVVQDYSASATFTWTAAKPAGAYELEVDVRDQGSNVTYDTVDDLPFTVGP